MSNTSSLSRAIADPMWVEAPDRESSAWDVVSGSEKKTYFARSPWATIVAYARGFVVRNEVTGGQHPVATWDEASALRAQLAQRYAQLSSATGW